MSLSYQQSPGVLITEIDNSLVASGINVNAAAHAGIFRWGPIMQPQTITSEESLVAMFGKPSRYNQQSFFTAANFLRYSNNLLNIRIDTTGQYTATPTHRTAITGTITVANGTTAVTGTGTNFTGQLVVGDKLITSNYLTIGTVATITDGTHLVLSTNMTNPNLSGVTAYIDKRIAIKNEDDFYANYEDSLATELGMFAARYPGALGNSLKVLVFDNASYKHYAGTGTITTTTSSPSVTVAGVSDASYFQVGDVLEQAVTVNSITSYETVGVIAKVNSNTLLTLTSNATKTLTTAAYTVSIDPELQGLFIGKPSTSDYAIARGYSSALDEVHMVVIDSRGLFTGAAGAVLERYSFKSKFKDAVQDGESIYYKNVLNKTSKYVYCIDSPTVSEVGGTGIDWDTIITDEADATAVSKLLVQPLYVQLSGGSDSDIIADQNVIDSDKILALQLLENKDLYSINSIILGKASANVAVEAIAIAEKRQDCVVFVSPEHTDGTPITGTGTSAVNKILLYRDSLPSTSYAFLDSGYKQQLDYYNQVKVNIPLCGDIAGLNAITPNPWDSPGGFNRGQLRNTNKLLFNPSKADRDVLYPKGVNSVVSFKGQGTVLYGDKTLLAKPSAFDRIGVRNLFIFLEKTIERTSQYELFELNDAFTRSQFKNLLEPFLRDIKGRRGIYDFKVVCDETNNNASIRETNQFVGDIFIKINYSINFINLNFIATRQSASFTING